MNCTFICSYFPSYIEGKHKTGIKEASVYDKRLYLVTGRKYPRASCVSKLYCINYSLF